MSQKQGGRNGPDTFQVLLFNFPINHPTANITHTDTHL